MTDLTLRQKVAQLMVIGFQGYHSTNCLEIKRLIRDDHIGGLILFGRNIGTPEQVLELTTSLQIHAKESEHQLPLLISIDQENGIVRRLGKGTTMFPGSMLLGATNDEKLTYEIGKATARELKALGINWNLAPVVDINNNPDNPVIGVRSFGETAEHVSRFSMASMKGMQAGGVITTLKHFPGHGDTHVDSHLELPVIPHSLQSLEKLELIPFKDCIKQGADTIMTAHVYFPALERDEKLPATMSKRVITGLLRQQLEFNGVVITDCMEMKAIIDTVGAPTGAIEAIKAGTDMIMISHDPTLQVETIDAVVAAVKSGEIPEERLEEAYNRVKNLKEKYLSWSNIQLNIETLVVPEIVGCEKHQQLAEQAFRKGVTIVKNEGKIIPINASENHKVMVIHPTTSYLTLVEEKGYSSNELGSIVQTVHPSAKIYPTSQDPTKEEISKIIHQAKFCDTLIVGTLSARQSEGQQALLNRLVEIGKPMIVVGMRNPYDFAIIPNVAAFVTTYEFTVDALQMAVKAIYGRETVTGKLPITITGNS
ncbi:beta-N-acetylhexosaminidase [Bacillus pinisoli]|uniref:beta-N-acetylhexosaminidase n=1 Tax=Bacillus pinisoli TaxID=2901866 RepID=UPI001FF3AE7C|nr:beta-N-acetylhexosaminidase [Bacillus pinisoli]